MVTGSVPHVGVPVTGAASAWDPAAGAPLPGAEQAPRSRPPTANGAITRDRRNRPAREWDMGVASFGTGSTSWSAPGRPPTGTAPIVDAGRGDPQPPAGAPGTAC